MRFRSLNSKELHSVVQEFAAQTYSSRGKPAVLIGHATVRRIWCITAYQIYLGNYHVEHLLISFRWGSCCCDHNGILMYLGKGDRLAHDVEVATDALLVEDATKDQIENCLRGMIGAEVVFFEGEGLVSRSRN